MTTTKEQQIEQKLINKLVDLKYIYREDIRDRDALEGNFREKFEALNKVKLTCQGRAENVLNSVG